MKTRVIASILSVALLVSGCGLRTTKDLEAENAELKAQLAELQGSPSSSSQSSSKDNPASDAMPVFDEEVSDSSADDLETRYARLDVDPMLEKAFDDSAQFGVDHLVLAMTEDELVEKFGIPIAKKKYLDHTCLVWEISENTDLIIYMYDDDGNSVYYQGYVTVDPWDGAVIRSEPSYEHPFVEWFREPEHSVDLEAIRDWIETEPRIGLNQNNYDLQSIKSYEELCDRFKTPGRVSGGRDEFLCIWNVTDYDCRITARFHKDGTIKNIELNFSSSLESESNKQTYR